MNNDVSGAANTPAGSARNRCIFLDTSEVVRLNFRFDRPPLLTLLERKRRGQAFLTIPSVIAKEWLVHAEQLVETAFQQINRAKRSTEVLVQLGLPGGSRLADSLVEEDAKKLMKDAVEGFITSAAISSLAFDLKPYDSDEVLRWYFSKQPPFNDQKEKSQFPDAFATSVMCEWARRHGMALNRPGNSGGRLV